MQTEQINIGLRIKGISNALDRMRTKDIAELGLTSTQSFVMGYLNRHQGEQISPTDLCSRFSLKQPTLTGILRRLAEKGFVRIAVSDTDRRCKTVEATQKSLQCHAQILAKIADNERMITSSMTAQEIEQLCALLDKVIYNVHAAGALPEYCCKGGQPHD